MTGPATSPQQPLTDDEIRLAVAQIIGSDLGAPPIWTSDDWRQALKTTATRWSPTRRQRLALRLAALRRRFHLAA